MDCQHDWDDVYYGVRCKKCEMFCPDGQGPWTPVDEDEEDKEDRIPNCLVCGGEFWDGGTSCTCQDDFEDEPMDLSEENALNGV